MTGLISDGEGNHHDAPLLTDQGWLASPVRRSANKNAGEYMQRRWLHSLVTRWDHQLTWRTLLNELAPAPGDRILEIGCGPGTWTKKVAGRCKEVVAVDISENMIAEAQKYAQGLPVQFIHSDFLTSPLQGQFDKVFSVRAIEYILHRDMLAGKISRVLLPGGKVILITKTRFSFWRGRRLLLRLVSGKPAVLRGVGLSETGIQREEPAAQVRQQLWSPGALARVFRPYGFVLQKVRPVVVRAPLFRGGFAEIPIIPDFLAPLFLRFSNLLYEAGSHMSPRLAFPLLVASESYSITLKYLPSNWPQLKE